MGAASKIIDNKVKTVSTDGKKKEDNYIIPFIQFYLPKYYPNCLEVELLHPDKSNKTKAPDYLLNELKIVVEVKEVSKAGDIYNRTAWQQTCNRLRDNFKERGIPGAHMVEISHFLNVRPGRGQEQKIVDKIVEQIKDGKIQKISDDGIGLFFYSSGFSSAASGASIDAGLMKSLLPLVKTANEQLNNYSPDITYRKILLLVQSYKWLPIGKGYGIKDNYESIVNNIVKTNGYSIDEIWVQSGPDENVKHDLVYTKA